ncbi:MAG TPA: hypothetical protein VKT77_09910 [Chthonomonadaceae bacterium]|nr:hypothetical protein [Chthonomonadaceae bacterium]
MATVGELFETPAEAKRAVEALTAAGWSRDEISIVAESPASEDRDGPPLAARDAEKGAVIGGLAGLFLGMGELAIPGVGPVIVAGWLAAALLGAGVGAAAGGLAGSLVEAGISHEHAGRLAEGIRRGDVLVTLRTDESRAAEAAALLAGCHSAPAAAEEKTEIPYGLS